MKSRMKVTARHFFIIGGIVLTVLSSVVHAERIIVRGSSPCPSHDASNSSWNSVHGCTCNSGWTGPSCKTPVAGPGPRAGSPGPSGNHSGGLSPRFHTSYFQPYFRGRSDIHGVPGTMGQQIRQLLASCEQAGGSATTIVDGGDRPVVECDMANGTYRECANISTGAWQCGVLSPSEVRVRNMLPR